MSETEKVRRHYAPEPLWARIEKLLADAGLSQRPLDPGALNALDHFYSGGFAATVFLADWADIRRGSRVLDIGAGFGGPARYLAATRGCDVTGMDLTEEYVEAAERLTGLCGLTGKVHFQVGNALSPAFPDRSFDVVWTQHVAMNIRDREGFYRQAARVLIPGGQFVTYDIVTNEPSAPIPYPMPWAENPSISSLRTLPQTQQSIAASGLRILDVRNVSNDISAWFEQSRPSAPAQANLATIMKPTFVEAVGNLRKSIQSGLISPVMIKAERSHRSA
jgi:sarcosine/dimethylglycine N-methyltransferase